ncbi:MAG: hypothetical protein WC707_06260 [Candidatus Babeliaceae bacterium]|jgi:hypothetical protein
MKKLIIASVILLALHNTICSEETTGLTPGNIYDGGFDDKFEELRDRQCGITVLDIVEHLATLSAPQLLQENFYNYTNPINVRPLVDLPSFQMSFFQLPFVPCEGGLSLQFFFNQMRDGYFTKCSPNLSSYLNLNVGSSLENKDLDALLGTTLPEVFSLFSKMKIEERRVGAMIGGYKNFNNNWVSAIIPMYWLESNFFLSLKEQEAIQNQPLFLNAGAGTDLDGEMAFGYQHLVSTKLGLGDLRLQIAHNFIMSNCSTILPAFEVTLPTSHAFNGKRLNLWFGDSVLFGGQYCKMCCPPPFDIEQLVCLAAGTIQEQAQAKTLATNFFVGALDRLTANLLDRPLGQEHTSLGPVVYYYRQLTEYMALQANIGFDYFIPRPETRFFLVNKNSAEFARDYNDPNTAQDNLNFLTEQMVNLLYPAVCNVRVHPGMVGKGSLAFWYKSPYFHGLVGYDFWYKTKEYITVPYATTLLLNIDRGLRPSAYQGKIFAKFFAYMPCVCNYLYLGVSMDATVNNQGIGKDFTLSIDTVFRF